MSIRLEDTIAERAARARSARARRLVVRDGLEASRASVARRWSAVLAASTRPQDRPFLRGVMRRRPIEFSPDRRALQALRRVVHHVAQSTVDTPPLRQRSTEQLPTTQAA